MMTLKLKPFSPVPCAIAQAAIMVFLLAIPVVAWANGLGAIGKAFTIVIIPGIVVGIIAFVMSLANGILAGMGKRPHLALFILGLLSGALNFAPAVIWFFLKDRDALIFGMIHLGLGLLTIGLTIWGRTRPA